MAESRLQCPCGISVVNTAEIIKGTTLTDNKYLKAAVLGWSIELLLAFFLVSDDMVESSITLCWYRVPKVGQITINESSMLEAAIYHLLKEYFRGESSYIDILGLFLQTTFQTEMGQLIHFIAAPEDGVDMNKFSLKKYSLIVIYNTAHHSFYLPVAVAARPIILPSGSQTIESYTLAKSISSLRGNYGRKDSECERRVKVVFESLT